MAIRGWTGSAALTFVVGVCAAGATWAEGVGEVAVPLRRGLGVSLGLGEQYAGIGVQALYHVPVEGTRFSWAPAIALGFVPNVFPSEYVLDASAVRVFGASAAVAGAFGYRHRLAASLGYGLGGSIGLPVQNIFVDAEPIYGAFLEVGYELHGTSGFLLRLYPVGVVYGTHRLLGSGERWQFGLSLGIGRRLP